VLGQHAQQEGVQQREASGVTLAWHVRCALMRMGLQSGRLCHLPTHPGEW